MSCSVSRQRPIPLSEDWVAVTLVYIGSEALVDVAMHGSMGVNNANPLFGKKFGLGLNIVGIGLL